MPTRLSKQGYAIPVTVSLSAEHESMLAALEVRHNENRSAAVRRAIQLAYRHNPRRKASTPRK